MTVIGPSVSMFRANETRLRMWLTVFALFAWRLLIGSAISTDHVSSLFFKKKTINKFCSNPIGKKCIFIHVYIYTDYFFQIIYTHPFFGYFQFATLYFCRLFVLQFNCERIDCFWPSFSRVPLARLTKWSFELVLSKSSKINIFENWRVLVCNYLKSNKFIIPWIVQIPYYIEVPDRQQHPSHNP